MTAPDAAVPLDPPRFDPPAFDEPWQAGAFALVVQLHAAGAFSWSDWAAALSARIKAAEAGGESIDGSLYYQHWLAALEDLVSERGLAAPEALARRKAEWAEAYRHTPHGKPVVLGAAA